MRAWNRDSKRYILVHALLPRGVPAREAEYAVEKVSDALRGTILANWVQASLLFPMKLETFISISSQ